MSFANKILIMAGILAVLIAAFVVVFLKQPKEETAQAPTMPPGPTGPGAVAPPTTPGTTPMNMPGIPGQAAMATPKPSYIAPAAPAITAPTVRITNALADPFSGFPLPPPPPLPPPRPPRMRIAMLPPSAAKPDRVVRVSRPTGGATAPKKPSVGRHAGWIFNSHGQVVAIFEDREGNAKAIKVGDDVEGMRVKAILPDRIVLVDDTSGREETVKLQGLDTYQGKTREVDVTATPAAPRWGAP
ncbi:MAG: hypothetical protein ACYDBB_15615 [Armatimonadota bacterium]